MELSEDLKYRLAYLTLRLAFDAKLSSADAGAHPGLLAYLDLIAGSQMAGEASGKRYASQREKIESFIDAEFGEEILAIVNEAVSEIA
jgi:hypothetical protein